MDILQESALDALLAARRLEPSNNNGDPTVVLSPMVESAEPTVALSVVETAPAPVEDSEPFVPQFVPDAPPLTVGRKPIDDLKGKPDSMKTFADLGRRGESNTSSDPNHTALIKVVASLGIDELDALALGDTGVIPADLLSVVTTDAVADARKYAGNLANTKREQANGGADKPVSKLSSTRLTGFRNVGAAVAGRKTATEVVTTDFDVQAAPLTTEPLKTPRTKGGSEPLPKRNPGMAFIAEDRVLSAPQREALLAAQQITIQALNERSEQITPQALDEEEIERLRRERLAALRKTHAVFRPGTHDFDFTGRSSRKPTVQDAPPEAPTSTKSDKDDDNDRPGPPVDDDITEIIPRLHRDDVPTVPLPKVVIPEQSQPVMASEVVPPQTVSAAGVAIAGIAKTARPEIRRQLDSVFAAVSAALKFGSGNHRYNGRHRTAFA